MSELKKLTDREQQFVIEYLVDFNAAKAGLRAGFTNKKPIGWRVKRRKAVAAAIEEAIAARSRRTRITADRVLREYARIAFADVRNFTTKRDRDATDLKTVAELSDDDAAAVSELAPGTKGKGVRLKLHDKRHALDAIARHLGLFSKGQEPAESPSAAAERARELIRSKLAELARRRGHS